MADDLDVGTLGIDVQANLAEFERQSRTELKKVAERVGAEAGRSMGTSLSGSAANATRSSRAGERTAKEFLDGAKKEFRRREADTKEAMADNLMGDREARQRGQEAARAFNDSIRREIRRRARAGTLTGDDHLQLASALKRTGERGAREFQQPMQRLQGWMRGTFAVGLVGAVAYAMTQAVDLARRAALRIRQFLQRGSDVTKISEGFAELASGRGLSASGTVEALRRGTRGEVSQMELMRRANLALLSDLPLTERAMERIAVVSRRLGQAVGKDAAESFEYFIRAINTGQSDMLKQLGLVTTLEGAMRRYKQQAGESAEQLSEAERVTLLYNEVMTEAEEKVRRMGTESLTAAELLNRAAARMRDYVDASAAAVASSPPLLELLQSIAGEADASADSIQRLANRVGAFADVVADSWPVRASAWVTRDAFVNRFMAARALASDDEDSIGGAFSRAVARRDFISENRRLRGDIGAIDDPNAIRQMIDAQQQQVISLSRLTDETEAYNEAVRTRNALVERLRQLETPQPPAPPPPMDEAELKRLQAIIEQFERSLLSDPQRNLNDLLRVRDAASRLGDTSALAQVEPLIHNARREVERLNELAAQMPALFARIQPAVQTTFGELATVGMDANMSLQAFERDYALTMARLQEQAQRGIISDEQLQEAEEAALEEFNRKLLDLLTRLREASLLSEQVFLMITNAFKGGADETDSLAENLRNVAGVARGVLSVADAVGDIGDNARRSLQGIVDLVDGISAIKSATNLAGQIAGGVTAIGGAIGLVSGLFGESPAERERREAVRRNTEALQDMTLELRGFRVTADVIANARRGVSGALGAVGGLLGGGGTRAAMGTRAFEELLARHFGISAGELDRIAKDLGIEIRDGSGRLMRDGLEQLVEALDQAGAALVGFRQTVSDQRRQGDLEADIFDRDDDAFSRLQRETDLLRQFAPGLVPAGLDPSTPEGRAALEALIRTLFTQFAAGDLDLGGLTRDEFLDLIETIEGLLDETEGGVVGGDGSVRLGVSITEVQASRMLSELSTQTYYLSKIAAAVVGPISAAPMAMPQLSQAAAPNVVRIDSVEFVFPNLRGAITPESGRALGAAAAEGLRSRLSAAQHAAGGQGTSRIVVRTGG